MANEQKINDIIDIAAITKQVEATEQQLGRIIATIAEINKSGVTFKKADGAGIPEATKQIDELGRATQKLSNLQTDAGKAAYQKIQATKELTKAQQLQANATNELSGAWERARAKGQLLDKQARDLGFSMYELEKAGKKGTAEYQKLETEFNKVSKEAFEFNAEIKKVDAGINIHSKNVGNYDGAVTSLRQEIKNLTQTLATMEMQGKNNSKEYKTMVARLGELKDAVGDVQARSKFFADDARYINTVTQAVQGVVGAYSVWVGASELLGTKNEELEKIMRKMMALMTVMQGLQQVANALNKDSYVRVVAQVALDKIKVWWQNVSIVTTNAETGATQKATAAQIAYNVAKTASKGIVGLLIVAIAALVAGMVALTKINDKRAAQVIREETLTEDQIEAYKKLNDTRKKGLESTALEVANANILFEALKKTKEGTNARKNAIDEVNKAYGTYLPNLLTEKSSLNDIAEAQWLVVDAIKAKLQAEVTTEIAKQYVQRGAQLQAEKTMYEEQIKTINDYNKALLDYQARAQVGTLKPFEFAPELPANIATLGTAFQALEKIEPKLESVNAQIGANNSAMNSAINAAAKATVGLNLLTYAHENENKTKEKGNQIDKVKEFLTHEQIESILQLMEARKESNKVLSETEQLELEEAETLQKAGEAVQQLMENIRNSQPAANEFLDWWKSLSDIEKAQQVVDLFSKLTGVVSDFSEISDNKGKEEVENFKVQQDEKLRVLNERLRLGLISEEQYTAAKSDLELEFEAKKKEIEKREFARKKKLAYAEAVINGASAAISALKEKTLAMKIISLAFVALTLAAQLSKIQSSTPGYAKGRKDGPGEFAKVGEQGWEYTGIGTEIFKTPNSTTLTYLQPHQWVIPHAQSVQLEKSLKMPGVIMPGTVKEQKQNDDILNELKRLNKKPMAVINMDKDGIRAALVQGSSTMNFINNHILFKN